MRITVVGDLTTFEITWFDLFMGVIKHYCGSCNGWCSLCYDEAEEMIPPDERRC